MKLKSFEIEYDSMPPKELRGNSRTHWAARLKPKGAFQDETIAKLQEVSPGFMGKIKIKYICHYAGKPMDIDNLLTGMKYAQDCLAITGIIEDDNPEHVTGYEVEYLNVKHRKNIKLIMQVRQTDE